MSPIPNIPDTIARQIYAEHCRSLPPPPDGTSETRAIREQHAMTSVAHLVPENAAGADLAAQACGAMTPADRYVTLYPERAAVVLDAGGLPASLAFPPPDPSVITELLAGSSPLVRAFRQDRTSLAA
jgi:hypothetical protein